MEQFVCENLSVCYDSKIILNKLNLEINSGDFVSIIGENGSGKSTLIKTILGLIKPSYGKVTFNDISLKEIGYLPQQNPIQKNFPASVNEVVISGCQNHCGLRPFYNKSEKLIALSALQKMGILQLAKNSYSELSGGQKQRVLIARALCATKKAILLDEPTNSLDSKSASDFYDIILNLNKNEKITVIMISHDIELTKNYSDYIIKIQNGKAFHV